MPLSKPHADVERRHLNLIEWGFHIYSKENGVRMLLYTFEGDPTVGSIVMALSNPYVNVERRNVHLTKWRFHIYSKENGVRKLL